MSRRYLIGLCAAMAVGCISLLPPRSAGCREPLPPVVGAARRLLAENSAGNWQELLRLVAAVRDETLRRAERSPLEKPEKLACPERLTKNSVAAPGLHSLVHTARYASEFPPGPGSSYLNTAAAVIGGDLVPSVPALLKTNRRVKDRSWDGYIAGSVLIVDGEIDCTGYIHDSIVIATGPVRAQGYIYNSIVFSLGSDGESSIDLGGYLNHSVVVAENVKVPGYTFESIVYGMLECSDLRGADLRRPQAMLRLPLEIE